MKKLFSLLLILALALSLAACGGSAPADSHTVQDPAATFVPAAPVSAVGTWTLRDSGDPAYAPGQVSLVLDENGGGYRSVTQFKDDFVYADYMELRWSEGSVVIDGVGGITLLEGDTLTVTWNGVTSTYVRTGLAPAPLTPPACSYTSFAVYEELEEYPDDSFRLLFNADGTGTYTGHGQDLPMTWNRYFITVDGEESFYFVYDGSQLSVFDGEYQIILAAD